MSGETDLAALLASLEPELRPGEYVYVVVDDLHGLEPVAMVREAEGVTAVLPRERAEALGLGYDYVAAWITLRVHSALADAGLSCNVIAGYHHDHLLVPAGRGEEALAVLRDLSSRH